VSYEYILVENQDHITTITLNRPDSLNSINFEMNAELYDAWGTFRDDNDQWVAILTGAGDRSFSAGADLKAVAARDPNAIRKMPPVGFGAITKRMNIYKPMIAAINGYALGGGLEMAMACDIRIASEKASFGQPEVRWAMLANAGVMSRLPRLVPRAIAMRMLLTGERINAEEGYRVGLINEVVPLEQLMPRALEIAKTIATNGPLAVRYCKQVVLRGLSMSLEDSLELEDDLSRLNAATEDNKEGPKAFAEKRTPDFKAQ